MYNRVYEDDDLAPKVRSRGPKVWTTARTGRRDKAQAIEATRELRKPGWTPSSPAIVKSSTTPGYLRQIALNYQCLPRAWPVVSFGQDIHARDTGLLCMGLFSIFWILAAAEP